MKKLLLISAALIIMLSSLPVMAQDEGDEEYWPKDFLEAQFYGSFGMPTGDISEWHDSLGAKFGPGVGFEVGYFLTYTWVLGVGFTYNEFSIDNNPTDLAAEGLKHRLYYPNIYLKYYPELESNFAPYAKLSIGLDYAKFTTFVLNDNGDRYRQLSYDPAIAFNIGLGSFYFITDYSGLFAEVDYHYGKTSGIVGNYTASGDYDFEDNITNLEIKVGIRVIFGSDE